MLYRKGFTDSIMADIILTGVKGGVAEQVMYIPIINLFLPFLFSHGRLKARTTPISKVSKQALILL